MYRDIFTNKWVLGGVLLIILGGIAFIVFVEIETARFKRQSKQDLLDVQARARAASVNQSGQEVRSVGNETPTVAKPITDPIKEVDDFVDSPTETKTPEQTSPPAAAAEAEVSAFGFGAFPEVPEGMLDFAGNPFEPEWKEPDYPEYKNSRVSELIDRVLIKKWKEGDRDAVGASFQYNKVYLNYPNTIYVWYEESEDGDSISLETSGAGDVSLRIEHIQNGDIPPGIRIIDGETGGIDPYEYLGLNR